MLDEQGIIYSVVNRNCPHSVESVHVCLVLLRETSFHSVRYACPWDLCEGDCVWFLLCTW